MYVMPSLSQYEKKYPWPQKKLSVHPQLIAINLSPSPASTPVEVTPLSELQSHDSQIYKYNYYYYYQMHLTMHNNRYLHE